MGQTAPAGKIYFLNTGMSDCLLLESAGHYALIDAAEDTEYPKNKPYLKYRGYEREVVDFLLRHCRGENGRVTLDFVLGTHAHSDHLGGFDTVALCEEIDIRQAYLRPYDARRVFVMERVCWDNQEVYDEAVGAFRQRGVPICDDFDGRRVTLGEMALTFLYCGTHNRTRLAYGENVQSVVTLLEAGGARAALVGDMNYKAGDERRLAPQIGKVDLLKVGHHGTVGSTSARLLRTLCPEVAVVTNKRLGVFPDVWLKLRHYCREIYTTVEADGVCVEFSGDGTLRVTTGIMG
ncbi:MAG TPA: hypothetical protein IAC53_00375 [Candidatus Fimenecus excrementigallinarum]|uniref:Metallo-beta-lactamase domain-containing protein n=1 Tax=Candidatus Fimenecus excrementigallinarum TaxID=2840816 RepID=A0A9D1IDJ6_9FIRM|nr:hypothetical protein [Candidatus Fimenecus excrementigallinarum]